MFEPEDDKPVEPVINEQAPLAVVPLDIGQIALTAAKRGDNNLLRVLLGPSIASEREKDIAVSAKIRRLDDQQRLYAFMFTLTEKRLAIIQEFRQVNPDYRRVETLNKKLADATESVITASVVKPEQGENANSEFCIELNDHPLIDMTLDIDENQYLENAGNRLSEESSVSSIKTFLLTQGISFSPEAKCVHLWVTKAFNQAIESVWYERFALRASKMVMNSLQSESELDAVEAELTKQYRLYDAHGENIQREKNGLVTERTSLENAFMQRAHEQLAIIADYQSAPSTLPNSECLGFLSQATTRLKFSMKMHEVMHLAGTPDHPKKIWISPQLADAKGNTLLHLAAENKRYRTVNLLLKYGVPLDARNHDDKTPAQLADMEDNELVDLAKKYSREKKSEFLEAERQMIVNYKLNAKKILDSGWNRFWYSWFHDLDILKERIQVEVPALLEQIRESYQDISDMGFALKVMELYKEAKRGLRNKSELHQAAMNLALRYVSEQDFGVKLESEVIRLRAITGMATPEGKNNFELKLKEATEKLKEQYDEMHEKALSLKGIAIAKLQSENQALKEDLGKVLVISSEKDKRLAQQEARIHQQDIELQALKSKVAQQEVTLKDTQDSMKTLEARMEEKMQDKMMEMWRKMEGDKMKVVQADRAVEQSLTSSPIEIPAASVAHHASTVFGASEGASPTPPSQAGNVHLRHFSMSGASAE